MSDKHLHCENNVDRCPCSTGDYSELFSKTKSNKRTDLRMGIFYFFVLIFSAINKYLFIVSLIVSILTVIYFIIKKDKNMFFRSIALIVFCIIGMLFIK